jgi:hypothetical protein
MTKRPIRKARRKARRAKVKTGVQDAVLLIGSLNKRLEVVEAALGIQTPGMKIPK